MTSHATCPECGEPYTVCPDCLEVYCGCDREVAQLETRAAIDSECDRLNATAPAGTDAEGGDGEYPW